MCLHFEVLQIFSKIPISIYLSETYSVQPEGHNPNLADESQTVNPREVLNQLYEAQYQAYEANNDDQARSLNDEISNLEYIVYPNLTDDEDKS